MRLRFIDSPTDEDRRKLKPAVGDTVSFEGTEYIVKEVGLKYVRAVRKGGGQVVHIIKIQDAVKVFPHTEGGVSPNLVYNP